MNKAKEKKRPPLFMFDIDGTLIHESIEPDYPGLFNFISQKKEDGAVFGINTSRPWQTANKVYSRLGLNGPIIFENGACYKLKKNFKTAFDGGINVGFKKSVLRVIKGFLLKNSEKYALKISDDKSYLSNKLIPLLIFITKNRRFTISIYLRRKGEIVASDIRKFFIFLKKQLASKTHCKIITDYSNGKIFITNTNTNKISTLYNLSKRYFNDRNVIMISDNEDIPKNIDNRIIFCAVYGATKHYKKCAAYVAKRKGVDGIKEIIDQFIYSCA